MEYDIQITLSNTLWKHFFRIMFSLYVNIKHPTDKSPLMLNIFCVLNKKTNQPWIKKSNNRTKICVIWNSKSHIDAILLIRNNVHCFLQDRDFYCTLFKISCFINCFNITARYCFTAALSVRDRFYGVIGRFLVTEPGVVFTLEPKIKENYYYGRRV